MGVASSLLLNSGDPRIGSCDCVVASASADAPEDRNEQQQPFASLDSPLPPDPPSISSTLLQIYSQLLGPRLPCPLRPRQLLRFCDCCPQGCSEVRYTSHHTHLPSTSSRDRRTLAPAPSSPLTLRHTQICLSAEAVRAATHSSLHRYNYLALYSSHPLPLRTLDALRHASLLR